MIFRSQKYSTTDTLDAATITTTETAFATKIVEFGPGELITNTIWLAIIEMSSTGTGGPTFTLRLRTNNASGTEIANTGAATHPNVTNRGAQMFAMFYGTAAAGAAAAVLTSLGGVAPGTTPRNTTSQPVNLDTATGFSVVLTGQFSAGTAGNTAIVRKVTTIQIAA